MNYGTIESNLRSIGNEFGKSAYPTPFKGRNFMTDQITGQWKHSSGIYFELSYGRGIFSDWIYGVTFADDQGGDYHGTSKCCHSFEEVRETLESVLNNVSEEKGG